MAADPERAAALYARARTAFVEPCGQGDLARCIALEAAKPIRTARAEAQRAVSTLQFSAVAARTLAGASPEGATTRRAPPTSRATSSAPRG